MRTTEIQNLDIGIVQMHIRDAIRRHAYQMDKDRNRLNLVGVPQDAVVPKLFQGAVIVCFPVHSVPGGVV